jgi:hypothetical protein
MLAAVPHDLTNLEQIAHVYGGNFALYGMLGVGASVLVFIIAPWLKRLGSH